MIVLDKNPLEDIHNSNTVEFTMVNGRLFDSATMNEVGNNPKERGNFYWENNNYNQAFPWHESSQSFTAPGCTCQSTHN